MASAATCSPRRSTVPGPPARAGCGFTPAASTTPPRSRTISTAGSPFSRPSSTQSAPRFSSGRATENTDYTGRGSRGSSVASSMAVDLPTPLVLGSHIRVIRVPYSPPRFARSASRPQHSNLRSASPPNDQSFRLRQRSGPRFRAYNDAWIARCGPHRRTGSRGPG